MNCRKRCPAGCGLSRRRLLQGACALLAGAPLFTSCTSSHHEPPDQGTVRRIRPAGPGTACQPVVRACFVRRKQAYGMLWPGEIYDGEAARRNYAQQIQAAAAELNLRLDLRSVPIYSAEEADAWISESRAFGADGLLVVLLDRQAHAWPTARKAVESRTPTVVFSPLGSSFTTNTADLAGRTGCCICSTDDFSQVRYGLKMLAAAPRLRATRCLVLAGQRRQETRITGLGIALQYVPAEEFLQLYRQTPDTAEILALADQLIRGSMGMAGPTRQDVINGLKSYVVARSLLEREQADAISMDCLGALGGTDVSLPCIAWSRMNDDGIPAACEADTGAIATHILVQQLFDRPGFQQDPVADTVNDALVGAHCSCPTRLRGFDQPPEPYDIVPHHGKRDATARPRWRIGQRVTLADVVPGSGQKPAQIIFAAGTVLENVRVPPAGGCVVSVRVKFDGNTDILSFPGFHQLFFYGDWRKHLSQYCQLHGLEAVQA